MAVVANTIAHVTTVKQVRQLVGGSEDMTMPLFIIPSPYVELSEYFVKYLTQENSPSAALPMEYVWLRGVLFGPVSV